MVLDCCMFKPVLIPSLLCHHQLHDVKRGPFLQTSNARVPEGAVLQYQSLPKPLEHLHQLPVALYQLQCSGLSILWSECDSIWINLKSPLVLSARGSRQDCLPCLWSKAHSLHLALFRLVQGLQHEYLLLDLSKGLLLGAPVEIILSGHLRGLTIRLQFGMCILQIPEVRKKASISFLLVGGDIAVNFMITPISPLYSLKLHLPCRSLCPLLWFMAKLLIRTSQNIFFPFSKTSTVLPTQ